MALGVVTASEQVAAGGARISSALLLNRLSSRAWCFDQHTRGRSARRLWGRGGGEVGGGVIVEVVVGGRKRYTCITLGGAQRGTWWGAARAAKRKINQALLRSRANQAPAYL